MITSADGAATVEGTSGGLGNPTDRRVLRAVRGVADTILVGASTVRAERYGVPGPPPGRPDGRPRPRLAVVTGTADLPADLPLFADAAHRPLVLTTDDAPVERLDRLASVAEVERLAPRAPIDPGALVTHLGGRGARVVLCEGGPGLLGQLLAADLVDEACLTVAPRFVGGPGGRIVAGPSPRTPPAGLRLTRVLWDDEGYLFLRYTRAEA
jgi:riboflavin biosynthesis pyrimidine reductase